MKYIVVLMCLVGCFAVGASETRPTGEEVFGALLENGELELASEPLCQADIKLHQQLAIALSVAYESKNVTKITSSCAPSKFDKAGGTIDIWDCKMQVVEVNLTGEFVSSSTYMFGLTKGGSHTLVRGSLRCF